MKQELMEKYAALAIGTGVNVQEGQVVQIHASVDQYPFVRLLVKEAYARGAKRVDVEWADQPVTRMAYENETLEVLSEVPQWRREKLQLMTEELPCRLYVLSEDPDGLAGIDQQKMMKARQANARVAKPYRDAIDNKHQWSIVAMPSPEWARKVFPDLSEEEAFEKLGDAILQSVRVTEENDPAQAWAAHNATFAAVCEKLNAYRFTAMRYRSANGTNLEVGLMPESRWQGGGEYTLNGVYYNPNMPTEEVFTSPWAGKAEGTVVSTMPLSYNSQLIDGFSITFENGRAVSCQAEQGQALLEEMLAMDEGASMIGELALIPFDSPIANTGILFYETLFDENASCHIALGSGYENTMDGYETRSHEEAQAKGLNDSIIHVDFMIGAADLSIIGITEDGREIPVFIEGNWAPEFAQE
ncbi:MAG: aminopeptidase [Clostridia bacterium]|nr:aminopeptidase [Clostridia bacterium]